MDEKKIGRPRKYEGNEKQRRNKASAVYCKKNFKQLNIRIPFALWEELQCKAEAKNVSIRKFYRVQITKNDPVKSPVLHF